MTELRRPRLTSWTPESSLGLQPSRSLGNLGEETEARQRPANSMEERAAKADDDKRRKEMGRSLRIEHIGDRIRRSPEAEEFLLRHASDPMLRAIDHTFADSRLFAAKRTEHPDCRFAHGVSPGDEILRPMAVYEILDPAASAIYAKEKAKFYSGDWFQRVTSEPPVEALTDGIFDGAIDPFGPCGPLEHGEPCNEKVLFQAAPAQHVLEFLYTGLYDTGPSKALKVFGNGIYFQDVVCQADAHAGDPRDARQAGNPGAVMTGHLRLTPPEAAAARFVLVYRVLLGTAAKAIGRLDPPHDGHRHAGNAPTPIFERNSQGRRWAKPFTSLIGREREDSPTSEYIMKGPHASRCLPIALVAYKHCAARSEQTAGRLDRWW